MSRRKADTKDDSSGSTHESMRENPRRYSGVFAGIFLVIIGVILLLNVLGVINFSIWHGLATYWPIGLIFIGLAMILRLRWFTMAFLIIAVVLCTAYLAGVIHTNHITGSGIVMTKSYNLSDFNGVRSKIPAQIYLSQSSTGSGTNVTIVGNDNILEVIDPAVEDGTLVLRYKDDFTFWNVWNNDSIKVYVSAPNISSVYVDGAGSIRTITPISADSMKVSISGAGDVDMLLDVNTLETQISGFGDMRLSGKAKNYDADISGAGNIEAYNLSSEDVRIQISGSGSAHVNASRTLDVSISGAGDVKYLGDPKVTEHISGAGSVKQDDGH